MYADPAGIFLTENPIFQKKNAVLADFAAGLSLIIKQNLSGGCLEGGPVPLRPLLRSRRLSCNGDSYSSFIATILRATSMIIAAAQARPIAVSSWGWVRGTR